MIFTWSSWSLAGGFMSQPSFKVAFQLTFQRLSTASRREGSEMITSTKQRKLSGLMMLHLEKNMKNYCPIILQITNLSCGFPYRKQLSDGRSTAARGLPSCSPTHGFAETSPWSRGHDLPPRPGGFMSWAPCFFAGKQGGSQKWQLVESTYYTEFMIMALTLLKLYTHFLVVWKTVETRHYRRNIYSRWTLEQLNCPVEIFEAPGPWSFLVVGRHNALCPGLAAAVQNLASGYWLHIKITGDKWCLLFMVIPIKI